MRGLFPPPILEQNLDVQKTKIMTAHEQREEIKKMLRQDFNGFSYWDDALTIKTSPYTILARLYGATLTFDGEVKLLDNNGDWYTLSYKDRNVEYVAGSVLQRLRILKLFKNEQVAEK